MNLAPLSVPEIALAIGLGIACYTDLTRWKIPNVLNLALVVVGIVLHVALGQWKVALFGFSSAFTLHFLLWQLGVVKGGDAKLMIGLGALVGWSDMLETTLWQFVLLIPVGLSFLLAKGRLHHAIATFLRTRAGETTADDKLTYMPFAPVITAGWIAARLTDWFLVWK